MAGHVQKQPASQKQWTSPDKSERVYGTSKTIEKKKKKPQTAAAGGGMKPPSKPPKGPTGGDNKGPKDEGRRPDYKGSKDTNSSMGGLSKSSRKEETKNPRKPDDRQFKGSPQYQSMGNLKKSTKKYK
jgi:hypothetical protein